MKRTIFSWICPLLILSIIVFTGCSAKSAATAEQFQTAAEKVGYTVEEQEAGSVESIHMASKDDSAMVFYVCSSESDAKTALTNLKNNLPDDAKPEHPVKTMMERIRRGQIQEKMVRFMGETSGK